MAQSSKVLDEHALQVLVFSGFSALPFELLDGPPTPDLMEVARAGAALARSSLDLVDETAP